MITGTTKCVSQIMDLMWNMVGNGSKKCEAEAAIIAVAMVLEMSASSPNDREHYLEHRKTARLIAAEIVSGARVRAKERNETSQEFS